MPQTFKNNFGDSFFKYFTKFFATIILFLIALIFYQIYLNAKPAIDKFGWEFLFTEVWDPVLDEYGALPFIYGTIVSSLLAIVIALPLSIGIAIFLVELCPKWLEKLFSFFVELLSGIPSIVYGIWGFFVMVPFIRIHIEPFLIKNFGSIPFFSGAPYGVGMFAAGLILAIMILPIIASITRDILKATPIMQKEAALALGSTKWEATRVALNYSKSGIFGAAILGLGRALGETMAVTMVIGNRPIISASLFDPSYTLASVLANEFTEATSDLYISVLIELALILFVITIIVNIIARFLIWSISKNYGK